MSVPLAGEPAPAFRATPLAAPYKTNRKTVFIVLSVAFLVVVIGFVFSGTLFVRYTSKFAQADRRHESLSWDGAPGEVLRTTYRNPAYGVTLKLPGAWTPSKVPTRFLCHLVAFDRFSAVMEADFPILTSSVDEDAALVARRYETNQGWALRSGESTTISGLPAHILRMTSPRGFDVDMVMVKKWPVLYALSVAGPSDDSEHWNTVRAALLQSIEIK
jgi:hypothetical protein